MRVPLSILILLLATAAHADIVTLKGGRTLRAVTVTTTGGETTLALTSGGTMSVPAAAIESVEPELTAAGLCAASPYRCQDRSMLMMRRAHAAAAPHAPQTPSH